MLPIYDLLDEKTRNIFDEKSYFDDDVETLAEMFIYKDLPTRTDFIERIVISNGKCAFWYNGKNNLIVTRCDFVGEPNEYGEGRDVICTTLNGKTKTFKDWINNDDVVIMFNNKLKSRDINVSRHSYIMAQIDKAFIFALIYSRLLPIPVCDDDKQIAQITEVIKKVINGEMSVVTYKNILSEINGEKGLTTLDLTDANKVNLLTVYNQVAHELNNRFFAKYGQPLNNGNGKKAQMQSDEVNGELTNSLILPLSRFECRLKAITELNEKFNLNASVDFGECWKYQVERMKMLSVADNADAFNKEETEEPEKQKKPKEPEKEPEEEPEKEPEEERKE